MIYIANNHWNLYTCCKSYLSYLYYGLYREDLEKQTNLTSKYHGRMKELQVLLESSRSRVQVNIKRINEMIILFLLLLFHFQNKIFKSLMRESVWIFIDSNVRILVTLTYQRSRIHSITSWECVVKQ